MSSVINIANPWGRRGPDTVFDTETILVNGKVVVLVHERADNHGVSITNAAEAVYAAVQVYHPAAVVEVYDESSIESGRPLPNTYDLVTLDAQGHAQWTHLGFTLADAREKLVGIL